MEGSGQSTLRAKYLDWCSARLAERFLDLSPEEIYALARPDPEGSARGEPAGEGAGELPPDRASDAVPESTGPGPTSTGSASATSSVPPARRAESAPAELPAPTDDGYRLVVQRVTEVLLKRTSLPTFEQWAEAYRENPGRFDAELLGFWKDVVGEEPTGADGA